MSSGTRTINCHSNALMEPKKCLYARPLTRSAPLSVGGELVTLWVRGVLSSIYEYQARMWCASLSP